MLPFRSGYMWMPTLFSTVLVLARMSHCKQLQPSRPARLSTQKAHSTRTPTTPRCQNMTHRD